MPTEKQSLFMQLDADARLAAAAGGVARYFADAAGLETATVAKLQTAIVEICTREFAQLMPVSPRLVLTFTRLPDRIEVVVTRRSEGSTQLPGDHSTPAGVDTVQYDSQGGSEITRLIKYVGEPSSAG